MSMASESEEMTSSKGSKITSIAGGSVLLKKGPWTSAEDAILVDYVTKHGEGNWNAVQKHSGLARCGKSCRLRWANHLRPDLKKGAFTPEEERRIIELHAKMGNKWARMAAELPGRTDNEIKNYWNTRIKRRQRAGLPIYPPDICLKTINARNQDEDMSTFSGGSKQHYNILGTNSSEIPAVEFKKLELNQHSYPPAIVDIPASNLLGHGLSVHPSKRLRGTETLFFPGLSANAGDFQLACGPTYFDQSFGISSSAYNQNLASDHPFLGVIHGSHASLNSNSCSSDPSWEKKLELPSLQNQMGSWYSPSSPLQSLESIDTLIQSPLTEHTETSSLSPLNSGLLDAVLYESHTKNNSYQETSDTCRLLGTIYDKNNPCSKIPKTEWEAYRDPISPLGHSSASLYSGSSLDKPQSVETLTGCKVKQEEDMDWFPIQYDESNNNIISRPDLSLASNCLHHQTNYNKSHSVLKEVFGVALFDDFGRDCKNVGSMAPPSRGCAGCSSSWDAMSAV